MPRNVPFTKPPLGTYGLATWLRAAANVAEAKRIGVVISPEFAREIADTIAPRDAKGSAA